jgi:hypothetical protein
MKNLIAALIIILTSCTISNGQQCCFMQHTNEYRHVYYQQQYVLYPQQYYVPVVYYPPYPYAYQYVNQWNYAQPLINYDDRYVYQYNYNVAPRYFMNYSHFYRYNY